jgi:hypothetical protein
VYGPRKATCSRTRGHANARPCSTYSTRVKQTEEHQNDKSEETKTATGLQGSKTNRYNRKGYVDSRDDLPSCGTNSQGNHRRSEENQMTRPRWYSPQLSREIISRLYHKAKAEGIAMTTLLNQIVEQALDAENPDEMRTPNKSANVHGPK